MSDLTTFLNEQVIALRLENAELKEEAHELRTIIFELIKEDVTEDYVEYVKRKVWDVSKG